MCKSWGEGGGVQKLLNLALGENTQLPEAPFILCVSAAPYWKLGWSWSQDWFRELKNLLPALPASKDHSSKSHVFFETESHNPLITAFYGIEQSLQTKIIILLKVSIAVIKSWPKQIEEVYLASPQRRGVLTQMHISLPRCIFFIEAKQGIPVREKEPKAGNSQRSH